MVEDRDDITISTTFGKVTETETSDTWGYDATSTSKYATTPLFGCVRYIDKADQKAIAEMKNMLDENGAVSSASKTPGWRMIISCGIIDSADEDDSVLSSGAVDTSTDWYKNFKTVLDDAEKDSKEQASGTRASADTKLGAYAVKGNEKVTAGTGVPEVYVAPTD